MKILAVSDLHVDTHADEGRTCFRELAKLNPDVLVVAGDLCNFPALELSLDLLAATGLDHIVYVNGNHELWSASPFHVRDVRFKLRRQYPNIHWLDDSVIEIKGQRFVGSTLWFYDDPLSVGKRWMIGDFSMIKGLVPWVFTAHDRSVEFLHAEVRPGDVVVTHHLPTPACISDEWKGSPTNSFYVSNLHQFVEDCGASLWIHGHSHTSWDSIVGRTRLVRNPFGYARHAENANFDWAKIISVEPVARTPTNESQVRGVPDDDSLR